MHEAPRYGIFQVGQVWRLVSPDGLELGFPDREHALTEAQRLLERHLVSGNPCEVMMLDEAGRLAPIRSLAGAGEAVASAIG